MKKRLLGLLSIVAFAALTWAPPVMAQPQTKVFNGFLYSMLNAINTEDEEPVYYLQTFDNRDYLVLKRATKKHEDPTLQQFLGKKVTIEGVEMNNTIDYLHIHLYEKD